MKSKTKGNLKWLIVCAKVLAIFNILFFKLGLASQEKTVWISYGFIMFAFVLMVLVPFIAPSDNNRSVAIASMFALCRIYFIVVFALGLFFIISRIEAPSVCLWINIVLLLAWGIFFVINLAAISHAVTDTRRVKSAESKQVQVSKLLEMAETLAAQSNNLDMPEIRKQIRSLRDDIRAIPMDTIINNTDSAIGGIMEVCDQLKNSVISNDAAAATAAISRVKTLLASL